MMYFLLFAFYLLLGTANADWIQCPVRQQVWADKLNGGTIIVYSPALAFVNTWTAVVVNDAKGIPQSYLIYTNDSVAKEGKCNRLTRTEILKQIGGSVNINQMEKLPQHASLYWLWNWLSSALAWAASFGPDAFTRADEVPIATPYDTTSYSAYYPMILESNHVRGSDLCVSNNSSAYAEYTGATFNDDHYAQIELRSITGADEISGSVLLRLTVDTDAPKAYHFRAWKNNGSGYTTTVGQRNQAGEAIIASESGTTWVATDVLKGQVVGDDLTLYRNGVSLLTAVGDSFIAAGGRTGFGIKCSTTTADMTLDNFSAGDTTVVPRRRGGAMIFQ